MTATLHDSASPNRLYERFVSGPVCRILSAEGHFCPWHPTHTVHGCPCVCRRQCRASRNQTCKPSIRHGHPIGRLDTTLKGALESGCSACWQRPCSCEVMTGLRDARGRVRQGSCRPACTTAVGVWASVLLQANVPKAYALQLTLQEIPCRINCGVIISVGVSGLAGLA